MTIYAIVNNLIPIQTGGYVTPPVWTLISQAAILQGGNPFFVPDFASVFEARPALAVKIGRLGKGIAPRFASRYVEAAAPAVVFVASDLLQSLKESGFPWTQAISYDRALALGKFSNISLEECKSCEIKLAIESKDSSIVEKWTSDSIVPGIEETIAAVSRDNALKMGDIFLFGIADSGPVVVPDMRARLLFDGIDSLAFNIR